MGRPTYILQPERMQGSVLLQRCSAGVYRRAGGVKAVSGGCRHACVQPFTRLGLLVL